MLTSYS